LAEGETIDAEPAEGCVVHRDEQGYYAVVATTRPETIMGDTAMCINPADPKNRWLSGRRWWCRMGRPRGARHRDDYVDVDFGTGCLKVTPRTTSTTICWADKHNLPSIDIFNDNGTLSEGPRHLRRHGPLRVRRLNRDRPARGRPAEKVED
jgi:valyl-tRNA synthetase